MAADYEDDRPFADDEVLQGFMEEKWRAAVGHAEDGREAIREIWPDLTVQLTETGAGHLRSALRNFESAIEDLNKAGRHVLGEEAHDQHLEQTARERVEARRNL